MRIIELLFPEKCPICGGLTPNGEKGICKECGEHMPRVTEPVCKHCGKPISSLEAEYCLDCNNKKSYLTEGTALWIYTEQMRSVMAGFKYGGCYEDGDTYIREFVKHKSEKIKGWHIDAIIPVPLHWRRKWFRGYNQAQYLAEGIGKALSIPVFSEVLERTRYTNPQKALSNKQRSENLKGAFSVNSEFFNVIGKWNSVLLIDDIYTTGSTLEECGRALKKHGVSNIYFGCLCIGKDY